MVQDKFRKHKSKKHKFTNKNKSKPKLYTKHIRSHHRKHSKFSISKLFYNIKRFVRKNPIFCSVASMVFAVILVRLAFLGTLFRKNFVELRLWIIFLALVFFIIGLISIRVWVRTNVPTVNMHFTHKKR